MVSSSKTRRNRTWNLRSMQCWRRTTENFSEKWRVGYSPSFVFDSEKTGNTWKYRNRTGSSRNMEQRTLPIPCHSIQIREKVLFQRDDRFYRWKYRLPYTAVGQRNILFHVQGAQNVAEMLGSSPSSRSSPVLRKQKFVISCHENSCLLKLHII